MYLEDIMFYGSYLIFSVVLLFYRKKNKLFILLNFIILNTIFFVSFIYYINNLIYGGFVEKLLGFFFMSFQILIFLIVKIYLKLK
jgi:hypothetical protein